jgi:hypothetical protein
MDWGAEFDHYIFMRLIKKHRIEPFSTIGHEILSDARNAKRGGVVAGESAKDYANAVVDRLVDKIEKNKKPDIELSLDPRIYVS